MWEEVLNRYFNLMGQVAKILTYFLARESVLTILYAIEHIPMALLPKWTPISKWYMT